MDCSRTTTERNSASHRNILKISSFLMNSPGAKMSCSGSRKSLASWAWSPKNQIQCTKASGAAAPGSNSRSPNLTNSLSAATHCQKAAGAISISGSFLLYPLRIIGVPGQSRPGPDLDERFLERFRALLHETVFYRISAAGDPSLNRFPSRI